MKDQLRELSEIINSFKSEAVQLRLVELLFEKEKQSQEMAIEREFAPAQYQGEIPVQKFKGEPRIVRTRTRRAKNRPGPSVILKTLVDENFFTENRTIGDVVNHCMSTYNYQYKSTDLSGTLARLVKEDILKRDKNPESNQFEYMKS
nr:hypothetical protein [Bacteroidota bacterium]